jgi:Fe-Mn family superoxide dismutase
MPTRRKALQTLALTSGGLLASGFPLLAQTTSSAATPSSAPEPEGVFKLPPLGYDYDALEPFIDAETMKIHHDKHHAAYVSKLNQAVAKAQISGQTVDELLGSLSKLPESVQNDIRNQGGGHANHTLFWQILRKNENGKPLGELASAIDKSFGSFQKFQEQFAETSMKLFGSGWVWLVARGKKTDKLELLATANQDSPLSLGATPLLGIDLWEHAYYLKHQNRRADYVQTFSKVLHWDFISDRFSKLA